MMMMMMVELASREANSAISGPANWNANNGDASNGHDTKEEDDEIVDGDGDYCNQRGDISAEMDLQEALPVTQQQQRELEVRPDQATDRSSLLLMLDYYLTFIHYFGFSIDPNDDTSSRYLSIRVKRAAAFASSMRLRHHDLPAVEPMRGHSQKDGQDQEEEEGARSRAASGSGRINLDREDWKTGTDRPGLRLGLRLSLGRGSGGGGGGGGGGSCGTSADLAGTSRGRVEAATTALGVSDEQFGASELRHQGERSLKVARLTRASATTKCYARSAHLRRASAKLIKRDKQRELDLSRGLRFADKTDKSKNKSKSKGLKLTIKLLAISLTGVLTLNHIVVLIDYVSQGSKAFPELLLELRLVMTKLSALIFVISWHRNQSTVRKLIRLVKSTSVNILARELTWSSDTAVTTTTISKTVTTTTTPQRQEDIARRRLKAIDGQILAWWLLCTTIIVIHFSLSEAEIKTAHHLWEWLDDYSLHTLSNATTSTTSLFLMASFDNYIYTVHVYGTRLIGSSIICIVCTFQLENINCLTRQALALLSTSQDKTMALCPLQPDRSSSSSSSHSHSHKNINKVTPDNQQQQQQHRWCCSWWPSIWGSLDSTSPCCVTSPVSASSGGTSAAPAASCCLKLDWAKQRDLCRAFYVLGESDWLQVERERRQLAPQGWLSSGLSECWRKLRLLASRAYLHTCHSHHHHHQCAMPQLDNLCAGISSSSKSRRIISGMRATLERRANRVTPFARRIFSAASTTLHESLQSRANCRESSQHEKIDEDRISSIGNIGARAENAPLGRLKQSQPSLGGAAHENENENENDDNKDWASTDLSRGARLDDSHDEPPAYNALLRNYLNDHTARERRRRATTRGAHEAALLGEQSARDAAHLRSNSASACANDHDDDCDDHDDDDDDDDEDEDDSMMTSFERAGLQSSSLIDDDYNETCGGGEKDNVKGGERKHSSTCGERISATSLPLNSGHQIELQLDNLARKYELIRTVNLRIDRCFGHILLGQYLFLFLMSCIDVVFFSLSFSTNTKTKYIIVSGTILLWLPYLLLYKYASDIGLASEKLLTGVRRLARLSLVLELSANQVSEQRQREASSSSYELASSSHMRPLPPPPFVNERALFWQKSTLWHYRHLFCRQLAEQTPPSSPVQELLGGEKKNRDEEADSSERANCKQQASNERTAKQQAAAKDDDDDESDANPRPTHQVHANQRHHHQPHEFAATSRARIFNKLDHVFKPSNLTIVGIMTMDKFFLLNFAKIVITASVMTIQFITKH